MYKTVSINSIKITQPILKLSTTERGRAKFSNVNPSRRNSKVERTVTPNPAQVLERKHVPIFVPLKIKHNNDGYEVA